MERGNIVRQLIQRIFPTRSSAADEQKTVPSDPGEIKAIEVGVAQVRQLLVGCAQSTGIQRDHNEDSLFALHVVLADGDAGLPFGLFIVCDGMGGHQFGEIASSVATRVMAEHILNALYLPFLKEKKLPVNEKKVQELLARGVHQAQQAVLQEAPGGGTTLTAALVLGSQITIAHVGDSRAYWIRHGGQIQAITQDHSLVQRLVEIGQLTEEQAAVHPQRNVLHRAVGQLEPFSADIITQQFSPQVALLVCSDGLWGVVSEKDICSIINSTSDLSQACLNLVKAANNAGGPDNISAILVRLV